MATCMNGLTRLSLSLVGTFWTHFVVKMPRTPSGKRRPCGTLLQLVVVNLFGMHRIGRSVEIAISVARSDSVILPILNKFAYSFLWEDSSRRAVWLGRRPVEKISIGPKVKLIRLGNPELSARAKAWLNAFRTARNAWTKVWPSEPTCSFNRSCVW